MLLYRLGCKQDQPQNVRIGRMGRPELRRGEEDLGGTPGLRGSPHCGGSASSRSLCIRGGDRGVWV